MSEQRNLELQWPPVCIGCGKSSDIIQEELIPSKEGIQTCNRCDKIGRLEQLSRKGWNLVFGLFAYIIVMDLTLSIGGPIIISSIAGIIAVIPPLYFDGVFSRIYSYDSYVRQKAIEVFEFRNKTYLNLFAASNPSIESLPLEGTPRNKIGFFRIISTIIVFIGIVIISLIIIVLPEGEFVAGYHLNMLLLSPWFVGSLLYFLLTRISKKHISHTFPHSVEISELPSIAPKLQPGLIASAAQWEIESNIAIHEGQKTISEKALEAVESSDYRDAIRLYKKSIDMDPSDTEAWVGIALAYAKAGRCIESRDAIHRAQDISSDPTAIQSKLEECAEICGMDFSPDAPAPPVVAPPVTVVSNEEDSLRKEIDADPMNPKIWAGLAAALARSGRCHDARDALQRAKDIDSKEPEIWSVLDECQTHCKTVFKLFGTDDTE